MIRFTYTLIIMLGLVVMVSSCEKDNLDARGEVPQEVITKLRNMGFNPDGIEVVDNGYRIERDIIITNEFLNSVHTDKHVPNLEQYSTNNLVTTNGNRVITVYAPEESASGGGGGKKGGGGSGGYSPAMIAGIDLAIARYNAENLEISFQRITTTNADITFTRLSKGEERQGILGSAGFPTDNGDPYNEIKMSGILESSYNLSTEGIATIIAHEMGHCIGMRHTDYFDRSISCGGAPSNEGPAEPIGANHIPGTPTGATAAAKSWMLSCTDGGDRPFNNDDKTALNYLY